MGLTNISEAVTSGVAAAGEASKLLASINAKMLEEDSAPERPVERETPLVSVILCRAKDKEAPEGLDLDPLVSAIKGLNGTDMKGRNITVNQAKPKAERPSRRPRY
jgi:hypothetical protein